MSGKIGSGFFGGPSPVDSEGPWSEFYMWDEVEREEQEVERLIREAEDQRERDEARAWDLYWSGQD